MSHHASVCSHHRTIIVDLNLHDHEVVIHCSVVITCSDMIVLLFTEYQPFFTITTFFLKIIKLNAQVHTYTLHDAYMTLMVTC